MPDCVRRRRPLSKRSAVRNNGIHRPRLRVGCQSFRVAEAEAAAPVQGRCAGAGGHAMAQEALCGHSSVAAAPAVALDIGDARL